MNMLDIQTDIKQVTHKTSTNSNTSQYLLIDFTPITIQFTLDLLIILALNLYTLYHLSKQIYHNVLQLSYNHNQNIKNQVYDLYDRILIIGGFKYLLVNVFCLIYFKNITSPPTMLFKILWLYVLMVVFVKFYTESIIKVNFILWGGIVTIVIVEVWIWRVVPLMTVLMLEEIIIIACGVYQGIKITRILQVNQLFNKPTYNKNKPDLQRSLLFNQHDEISLSMQQKLDDQIVIHLQNRRSFCFVVGGILFISLVLEVDLGFGKELIGEVMLSLVNDWMMVYVVVFWYLKHEDEQVNGNEKSDQQKQSQQKINNNIKKNPNSSHKYSHQKQSMPKLIQLQQFPLSRQLKTST